jgi:cell division GTPase FtsZ
MFVLADTENQGAVIKVIGVGGGGGNAVAHMISAGSKAWTSFASTPMRRR